MFFEEIKLLHPFLAVETQFPRLASMIGLQLVRWIYLEQGSDGAKGLTAIHRYSRHDMLIST